MNQPTDKDTRTYIHGGTIPPGGITHGSEASIFGGTKRPPEIFPKNQGIPFSSMYEMTPAMTPYAMLKKEI